MDGTILDKNKENNLILCKKCYQNGEYIIPSFYPNKEQFIIEYKCNKSHILKEEDILRITIDGEIKNSLTRCNVHEYDVFCGWCNECKKNLCFLCVSEEMRKKHKYPLFMQILPELEMEMIFKNQIEKLKSLLKRYKFYEPCLNLERKYLIDLIFYSETTINLFYKKEIMNYQTINNIKLIFNDMDINIKELEDKLPDQYLDLYFRNFKKSELNVMEQIEKKVHKTKKINEIKGPINLLTLINDNKDENKRQYFVLLYEDQSKLVLYDNNLILINFIIFNKL